MKRKLAFLLVLVLFAAALAGHALAADALVIEDDAELFSAGEEAKLIGAYSVITEYMDAAVVTTDRNSGSTSSFAENYAIRNYGNDPAVIFVIDMDNREIYLYANGPALKTISKADSRAITDNIYRDASRGDYYACASGALEQVLGKLQGQRLARPVKHITNALIAVLFGVLINYFFAVFSRRPRAEKRTQGVVTARAQTGKTLMPGLALFAPVVIGSVRHYKSSGSGGSGGGGGGGGGGHSGGGGGHSF